jgi:hypothetical protein
MKQQMRFRLVFESNVQAFASIFFISACVWISGNVLNTKLFLKIVEKTSYVLLNDFESRIFEISKTLKSLLIREDSTVSLLIIKFFLGSILRRIGKTKTL